MMARGEKWRWWCSAMLVAAACLGASGVEAKPAKPYPKSKLKDLKVPTGKHFIDMVGTVVLPDDVGDMHERFTDEQNPHVPGNSPVLNAGVDKWVRAMRSDIDEFITYYSETTGNPIPPYGKPDIYILQDTDINCLIVRENYDKAGQTVNTAVLGFLDTGTATTNNNSTSAIGSEPPAATGPSHIQMQCTNAALKNIGGEHFGEALPPGVTESTQEAQDDARGQAEIAFIMGHEISHVLLGHYKVQEADARKQQKLNTFFKIGWAALSLANSKYRRVGNTIYVTPTAKASKDVTKLLVGTHIINEMNVAVLGPKWQRDLERQADIMSIDMINGINTREVAAGRPVMWDPSAARDYLDQVEKVEKAQKKIDDAKFGNEIAATIANGLLGALGEQSANGSGGNVINALATEVAYKAYAHWRNTSIAHMHDYAEERSDTIGEYLHPPATASNVAMSDTAMPPADAAPTSSIPRPDIQKLYGGRLWDGVSYREAVKAQDEAEALLNELEDKGCDQPSAEAQAFLAQEAANGPKTQIENFALGNYSVCTTKWKEAIPYFKAAAYGVQHYDPYFVTLIQTELLVGDYDGALASLDDAERNATQGTTQYLSMRIAALYGLKRTDEADKLADDCKAKQSVDIGTACMASDGKNYDGSPLPKDDDIDDTSPSDQSKASSVDYLKKLLGADSATTKDE